MNYRHAPCTKAGQRGVSLLESLIGSMMLAIIFIGMGQILAKNLRAQGENYAMGLTLMEVREQLQQTSKGISSLCKGQSLDSLWFTQNVGLAASCSGSASVTISLPGISANPGPVTLEQVTVSTQPGDGAEAGKLFGGDGVVAVSTTF